MARDVFSDSFYDENGVPRIFNSGYKQIEVPITNDDGALEASSLLRDFIDPELPPVTPIDEVISNTDLLSEARAKIEDSYNNPTTEF